MPEKTAFGAAQAMTANTEKLFDFQERQLDYHAKNQMMLKNCCFCHCLWSGKNLRRDLKI
jgi:hypothetical protein